MAAVPEAGRRCRAVLAEAVGRSEIPCFRRLISIEGFGRYGEAGMIISMTRGAARQPEAIASIGGELIRGPRLTKRRYFGLLLPSREV